MAEFAASFKPREYWRQTRSKWQACRSPLPFQSAARYQPRFHALPLNRICPPMPFTRLCRAVDVAVESSLPVEHDGLKWLVVHSKGKFYVVRNLCSHAEESLECGKVRSGWVACPVHGARFDLETGKPKNPPAIDPITTYPCHIQNGWVEARLRG